MSRWLANLIAGLALVAAPALLVVPRAVAAFSDMEAVPSNTFTTGGWCSLPGGQIVRAIADAWTDESSPSESRGTDSSLLIRSKWGLDARVFVMFNLPALPEGCSVTLATLRMYNNGPVVGRTILAFRADATTSWTEGGLAWSTQPPSVGSGASSVTDATHGWQMWTVTTQVQAMYSGSNSGFLVRDQSEEDAVGVQQQYSSREGAAIPELIIDWG